MMLRNTLLRSPHPRFAFTARNIQTTSNPKRLTSRLLTSPYLFAGVLAWTGIGAYYLFPPTKDDPVAAAIDIPTISPKQFGPASLISSEITSRNTRLLTLSVPNFPVPSDDASLSPIWSIFVKDDDIQVERPYTPLEGIDEQGRIKLWIKKYPNGEVGRWLHSKNPGDIIEIRGPSKTWRWKGDVWDEIIMISGGTGITPFYQLLHHELLSKQSSSSRTRYTLLHSSLSPGELPPPVILDPLMAAAQEQPERFRLRLFVDSLDETPAPSEGLHIGRIDKSAVEQALDVQKPSMWNKTFKRAETTKEDYTRGRKVLFLVCGPDPMISAIAGPRGKKFSQGSIEGVLGTMGFESDEVRKL